jgi:hypothetical protein
MPMHADIRRMTSGEIENLTRSANADKSEPPARGRKRDGRRQRGAGLLWATSQGRPTGRFDFGRNPGERTVHRAPRRCGRGAHQTLHLCAFGGGERILYVDAQIANGTLRAGRHPKTLCEGCCSTRAMPMSTSAFRAPKRPSRLNRDLRLRGTERVGDRSSDGGRAKSGEPFIRNIWYYRRRA